MHRAHIAVAQTPGLPAGAPDELLGLGMVTHGIPPFESSFAREKRKYTEMKILRKKELLFSESMLE